MKAPTFTGLGQALRWLRERQTRKQYQVADLAGITKGMLSAYETGRQRPSLETLDKLLDTLGCDLNDLHNAIQIVNGRPEAIRRFAPPAPRPLLRSSAAPGAYGPAGATGIHHEHSKHGEPNGRHEPDEGYEHRAVAGCDEIAERPEASELYRVLGHTAPLPDPEERALAQMLDGFHQLIRYWDQALERLRRTRGPAPADPSEAERP